MSESNRQTWSGHRALVIGGSIGGLTAALLLRRLGFDVDVYERTPTDLDGRGGGIVLQPDTLRWFTECSDQHPETVSTSTHFVQYLGQDNAVLHRENAPWSYTSWGTFYRALLADFDLRAGTGHYHLGEYAAGFDQDADAVQVRFASGRVETAELVVFADGIGSPSRRRIAPGSGLEYSGYVGWRGTVPEREVSPETFELLHDSITYSVAPHTHINVYPIPAPGGGLRVGERLLNYVWYRNVPEGHLLDELMTDKRGFVAGVSLHPGQVQDRFVDEMRSAATARTGTGGRRGGAAHRIAVSAGGVRRRCVADGAGTGGARGRRRQRGAPARGGRHGQGRGERVGALRRAVRQRRHRRGAGQVGARPARPGAAAAAPGQGDGHPLAGRLQLGAR